MRKYRKQYAALCLAAGLAAAVAGGCGAQGADHTAGSEDEPGITEEAKDETPAAPGDNMPAASVDKTEEDPEAAWDPAKATGIVLDEAGTTVKGDGAEMVDSTAVIRQGGTYVVTGATEDGQIRIEAGDDETVHLVLNGAALASKTTAPIYSTGTCKVILTLEDGTVNAVSDSSAYENGNGNGEEAGNADGPDAPVFTGGDLTVNGTGRLEVTGNYQAGIHSKGNLVVSSGEIDIDAQDDGLKGKDSVTVRDGLIAIRSGKDGVKSNNDSDGEKGFIRIEGGNLTVAAQDDGIQAESALIVSGGTIDITESQEGLAGRTVDILDGVVKVVSADDGINSAASVETEEEKMQDQEGVYTRIKGGQVWIDAAADGIDSNGDLYVEGGALYISGPTGDGDGILDFNGKGTVSGGTVIAAGSAGMAQLFDGTESTQNFLVVYYSETQKAGTQIRLADMDGKELGSYTPEKDYKMAIISSPDIQTGSTYQVVTGDVTMELAVSGRLTQYGTALSRGGKGPGGAGVGPDGTERPDGAGRPDGTERPDGAGRPDGSGERPDGTERPDAAGERPDMGQKARMPG